MGTARDYVRIDGEATTLVFALAKGGAADLVYLGARLPAGEDLPALAATQARSVHESQPDTPPTPGLLPERKGGWSGTPAIILREKGMELDTDFRVSGWEAKPAGLRITFKDRVHDVEIRLTWSVGDVVICRSELHNCGSKTLALDHFASLALPIPRRFTQITRFSGRWAGEMRERTDTLTPHGLADESSAGKPGFGGGNWLLLSDAETGETLGAHMAWSADYNTRIDGDPQGSADGRSVLQMAARWSSGALLLPPGHLWPGPKAVFAIGPNRSDLGQRLHRYTREMELPNRGQWPERKVHLNSWEALGFNLTEDALIELVKSAASIGAERFVLDDGWFGTKGNRRRNDTSGLGDWQVSPDIFPNGLGPLIERVHASGMDFGLWVEPEMVSPDSDLYRAHPDWCVHREGRDRATMRRQLTLDLSRRDVCDYLYERLEELLDRYPIAYLKWDHNRDAFPAPRSSLEQNFALQGLMGRLRRHRPELEIESCSSGGGRIDYDILSRTHRVWPSDNNDAIERVRIIRAWSQFLPLEVLGNHVGPSPNPITGRRLRMDFRAKVAMFGHMGVEADPRAMSQRERANLAAHIALYKEWRDVLHTGDLIRIDHPDPGVSGLMVRHQSRALALVAQTGFAQNFDTAPVRLAGLDCESLYRVSLPEPWPLKPSLYLPDPEQWRAGLTLSGRALMTQGLALPLTHPETAWLIALETVKP